MLGEHKATKWEYFFKNAIKQHNSLIIIINTNIDKSKVRQKSDKFCLHFNLSFNQKDITFELSST